jgi:antagonist of KipI
VRRTSIEVRFVLGPEAELFTDREHEAFVTSSYVVHQDSNSLGLRLDGPEVASPPQILSEGQPAGSVQIPPGGQPIVLLPARQTLGGYAKIAVVVRPDLAMLAQALPGDVVTFTRMDFEDATALTRQWLGELTSATAVTCTLEAG